MSLGELKRSNVRRFQRPTASAVEASGAVAALDVQRKPADDFDARSRAADALKAAYLQVRGRVTPSSWLMIFEPTVQATDHFVFRFAMHCDGVLISACGFAVGPGRAVVFGRPGHRAVTGALDTMGEPEFHSLLEAWVREVQAGIGHRWHYEAKLRGNGGEPCRPPS